MKPTFYIFCLCLLIASCNPDNINFSDGAENTSTRAIHSGILSSAPDSLTTLGMAVAPITYAELGASDKLGVAVQVPIIPDDYIEPAGLVAQFNELAKFTNGDVSYVDHAREITSTVIGILDTHLVDNTDLVFLIDATASMQDDIDNVKRGVTTIIRHVQMQENVRVGVAIYRDRADGGALWYQHLPLTNDFEAVINYVNAIVPCCGSWDWPESVYDGAYLTLDTMNWRSDSPKMMLLIGDAPGLLGNRTEHTLEDVVLKSKEVGVDMNFYPVIITTEMTTHPAVLNPSAASTYNKFLARMYPNPTAGEVNIELSSMAIYTWQVTDVAGGALESGAGFTNNIRLDLSGLPNGVYNISVSRDGITENKMIVVAH